VLTRGCVARVLAAVVLETAGLIFLLDVNRRRVSLCVVPVLRLVWPARKCVQGQARLGGVRGRSL